MLGVKSLITGLKRVSIVAILCGLSAGCGGKDGLRINKESSPGKGEQRPSSNSEAGLSLAMPANLPAWVDTVHVTLEQLVAGVSGTCKSTPTDGKLLGRPCSLQQNILTALSADFALNGKPIRINDLAQGDYLISVSTFSAKTGRVHSQGDGSVTIKAGQVATAHITMTYVGDDNGSLVIVLDDANQPKPMPLPFPGACVVDTMALSRVCVSVGKSLTYRLEGYVINPNTCQRELPVGVQQVDAKFCQSPQPKGIGDQTVRVSY